MVRLPWWRSKIEWVQDSQATGLYRSALYYVLVNASDCPYKVQHSIHHNIKRGLRIIVPRKDKDGACNDAAYQDRDSGWFIHGNIYHDRYQGEYSDNSQRERPCSGYYVSVLLPQVE
jgi:hypothetical protein